MMTPVIGHDLPQFKDLSNIERGLEKVLGIGGAYLESAEATEGTAAAETVARLHGKFGRRAMSLMPENLQS